MRIRWMLVAFGTLCALLGAMTAQGQNPAGNGQDSSTSDQTHWYSATWIKKLNPVPYVRKPIDYLKSDSSKTANEQLAANSAEEKHLTAQLQSHGLLPGHTALKDACSNFKSLDDCIAALHASHNVGVKFDCLKWNMTAEKPDGAAKVCQEPDYGHPVTLERAIRGLKPDADAREEAKNALRQARENISDAKS